MWNHWQAEWLLGSKVDFDGINRLIIVHPEVTTLNIREDVYTAWVKWLPLQEKNTYYFPAIRYTGFDVIPGGFSGDNYFLYNGWKLLIDIRKVKVDGILYSDDYDTAYFDIETLDPIYPAKVSSLFSVIAPTISVDGIDIPSAAEIRQEIDLNSTKLQQIKAKTDLITTVEVPSAQDVANAVRTELTPELTKIMALESNPGLTENQATMLLELYAIMGLDPSKPLVVTQTNRSAGQISQTITGNESITTVTRV